MRFISSLIFLVSFSSYALTETEVRESVLSNFQLIEEAQLKLEASKAEITAAEGSFDHKLNFKSRNRIEEKYDNSFFETTLERNTGIKGLGLVIGHRQGLGHFPAYDGKYETSGAGEIFAGLSLPLLRNFSTDTARTNLEISKLEKEQAQQQLKLKQNLYIHKALSLYYKWLLEERKYKIRQSILDLANNRNEMLEKRFKSGDIEKVKLTDNQRSIDKRKDELLKTQVDLTSLRANLSIYLPNQPESTFSSHAPLDTDALKDFHFPYRTQFDDIPQIKILRLEIEKGKRLQKLYEQERLPGLSADLLAAKELSPNEPYDPERLQVGVKFDFPLENRKAEGKTTAQHYKQKALDKQLEFTHREMQQTYTYSLKGMELNKERWQTISGEAAKSKIMADAEFKRWKQGASELFTVNLREQDVADAEIRKWTALYDYQQFVLDLKFISNSI